MLFFLKIILHIVLQIIKKKDMKYKARKIVIVIVYNKSQQLDNSTISNEFSLVSPLNC